MPQLDVRAIRGKAKGDQFSDYIDSLSSETLVDSKDDTSLDSESARKEHARLLQWYYLEKERQATNRLEMAIDADFYDSIQWQEEDAAIVESRGQLPLVYNEIAPMIDWIIGTERRTRADWKVLPRTEDDVDLADIKTKVIKYVSDINRVPYARSRAFGDAVKAGVGWVDDGACDDPTQDILYSKYEDWRNVLWDSMSYELDLSDARYVFRWRWVDKDVAVMSFSNRRNAILEGVRDAYSYHQDDDESVWYQGTQLDPTHGTIYASGAGIIADAKRERVKLIECQYRKPARMFVVRSGPMQGSMFAPDDPAIENMMADGSDIVDRVVMRVHTAVFTESAMLSMSPSHYRHNRFSLTPIWCYRRSRDRLPYGMIRRVRDIQLDLNKRASKALFLLNTNQIIADEGAVDDWNLLRDEADRPDGMIVKKAGKELRIQRDTDAATGQIKMMELDAQTIQKTAGVNNENLGRATNAVSGAAIEARQSQGAVGTTEPFDNLRFAIQVQGEKQLSLVEQFYSEPKVIRLTGAKGQIEWQKINQPEIQPDGSVRWLNDITGSKADFVVSEQDYSGTMRQHMSESLNAMAAKLPPELAIRLLRIAMEFSDLPNRREIVDELRKITGEQDPNKEPSPEEMQAAQQQQQAQAESMEMQRQSAILALQEQKAKIAKLTAEAANVGATQIQGQATDQLDQVSQQLAKAQQELANRTMESNTKLEIAKLEADTKLRVAEIQAWSDAQIADLESKLKLIMSESQAEK